jgi:Fe-S-cluster containining protein
MSLYNKVRAVNAVFNSLLKETRQFAEKSGMQCPIGCSKCCLKEDIEATPLEFIPFAYDLYKQDKLFTFLDRMENMPTDGRCILYNPMQTLSEPGACSDYKNRGLICRLFGYSATYNKVGVKQVVTCQTMKNINAEHFIVISNKINNGMKIPLMRDYYLKLYSIDNNLSMKHYPINTAIKKAVEYVATYYIYRTKKVI